MIDVSTDVTRLDIGLIHRFLNEESSWAQEIALSTLEQAIAHSLCFGAYDNDMKAGDTKVGFARVVTDFATFAYLCDVFTLTHHRGRGIARLLIETVLTHPRLQGLRRFSLATTTAAGLYEKFGWVPLANPDAHRERYFPDIYVST